MSWHIRKATPADAEALARCVIESNRATFRGRVPDRCLEWLTPEESAANWRRYLASSGDHRFLRLAEDVDGRVAGYVLAGPQPGDGRFDAELYAIAVLPEDQGRGVGKSLISAAATRLRRDGLRSCGVRVLRANPNTAFYEHLGARYLDEEPYDWNGVILPQAVYIWSDINALPSRLA